MTDLTKTRGLVGLAVTAALALAGGALAASIGTETPSRAAATTRATAALVPPDGSQGVTATVTLLDTGSALRVTGNVTGLDPQKRYISLIYDTGSQPSGPNACIPSVLPPVGGLSFDQMQLGDWQPIGRSSRELNARRISVAYVPLSAIGTVSIRRHDQTGPAASLPLIACGKVNVVSS